MSVAIRPLARTDEADWRRLWTGYLDFYETRLPEEVYATYFERLLGDDPQDYAGLIAEVDGRPAGLAHVLFHRHGWRIENVCYLQDLYADPEVRGRGVGRAPPGSSTTGSASRPPSSSTREPECGPSSPSSRPSSCRPARPSRPTSPSAGRRPRSRCRR